MGVVGYDCFTPDYSELHKLLISPDGTLYNDMEYFQEVQGTASEGLAIGLARPQNPDVDMFADGLSDQQLFDSCIPKSIQTPQELLSYGQIFFDDLKSKK